MPPKTLPTRGKSVVPAPPALAGSRLGVYSRASDDPEDTGTSVDSQSGFGLRLGERHGCQVTEYSDNNRSASWYAKKGRPDFERMLRDIEAGRLDYAWFWTVNRSQRDLGVFVHLRDLCRRKGVGIIIKSRVFNLSDPSDLRMLGTDAVNGEVQSIEISENTRAGIALAASRGKPHGPLTYGYRRIYDERGKYIEQLPKEPQASVAAEIITFVANGKPLSWIKRDLERRRILTPTGKSKWRTATIRSIAMNKAYIGIRVHRSADGTVTETPDAWPAIVKPEVFYKARNILTQPERVTVKPGRGVHLLSWVVHCKCGEPLVTKDSGGPKRKGRVNRRRYACAESCSSIIADELDKFVMTVIDVYLARPDVQAYLAAAQADDAVSTAARAEAARLRGEIESYKKLAESGQLDAADYLRFTTGLKTKVAEEEARAEEAAIPPVLRGEVDWTDIPVARQFVAAVADIRLKPVGKGKRVGMRDRLIWRWLIGPEAA